MKCATTASGLAVAILATSAAASEIDFAIGVTADGALDFTRPSQVDEPYDLPLIFEGSFAGLYGSIEPGWDGLAVDDEENGLGPIAESDAIAIMRVGFDDGFQMFDLDGNRILENDGDTHVFAGEPEDETMFWHEHLVFTVDGDTDPGTQVTARFKLTNPDGELADSEEFTLVFETSRTEMPPGMDEIDGVDACGAGACGAFGTVSGSLMLLGLVGTRRGRTKKGG